MTEGGCYLWGYARCIVKAAQVCTKITMGCLREELKVEKLKDQSSLMRSKWGK